MKVLVTGAFGNIGMSAVQALLELGYVVRCLDLKSRQNVRLAGALDGRIEVHWGSIQSFEDVRMAVQERDIVIHLAGILPPACNEQPSQAYRTNVQGTAHVLAAASELTRPPKIVFASSFMVFGRTQDRPPPLRVTDPVTATDHYTSHKLTCETMLQQTDLDWLIFRFADVPPLRLRQAHRMMFEIPLANRFEVLHTYDAGLAIAHALECAQVWRRVLLVGGGLACQIHYQDYIEGMLKLMGITPLPASAFTTTAYPADWLDTAESQHLLDYQRHSFDDILRDITWRAGGSNHVRTFLSPIIRKSLLHMSPYERYRKASRQPGD